MLGKTFEGNPVCPMPEPIPQNSEPLIQDPVDAAFERALAKARKGKSPVYSTPESIRRGEEFMAQARIAAAHNLVERIKRGEYISLEQLQAAWPVKRVTIIKAVATGRLFTVIGPLGEAYYPAFYSDSSLNRRMLQKVCKALGLLPAALKYHFFTSIFTSLGETPLEALRDGRVKEVLSTAAAYVEV